MVAKDNKVIDFLIVCYLLFVYFSQSIQKPVAKPPAESRVPRPRPVSPNLDDYVIVSNDAAHDEHEGFLLKSLFFFVCVLCHFN